jgi:hypothetical protein
MKIFNKVSVVSISVVTIALSLIGANSTLAATAPNLGAAESYAVFGKAGVTNNSAVGTTHIWGSVGADLVTNITNIVAAQVDGNINTGTGVGAAAQTAYGDLASQAATASLDLAGIKTVAPGVYTVAASTLNGTLTLDGAGVYIFRSSSSVSVLAGAKMNLINGASPCNVFWQIPTSMTIGSGAQLVGTIIANTGEITFGDSTRLQGRAFSLTTQVTLINDQITQPTCTSSSGSSSGTSQDIKVTKDANKKTLHSGPAKVTFTYKVTNEGDTALTDVSLKDDKCDDVNFKSGDDNNDKILDLKEEWKYTCKKTVKETETNTATVKGHANGKEVKDSADFKVTVSTPTLPNAGVGGNENSTSFWNKFFSLFSF